MVALAGCSGNVSTKPGGTTTHAGGSGAAGGGTATFMLKAGNVKVKQGDHATTKIEVARSGNFRQDVHVTITSPPDSKITIDPKEFEMKATEGAKEISVGADADAKPTDFEVKVDGKPTVGESTSVDFKVTVEAK